MKIFKDRTVQFAPFGQIIEYEDGTTEFDHGCQQTTPIQTAQQYNGKAAKDDAGEWVPAPGARIHEIEETLLGFKVGLTYMGGSDGRANYDYTVITPTGVAFHGDGKTNIISVPSNWLWVRVAAEAISWMCLGEDAGASFPENMSTEQWEWIRSYEREYASADVGEWLEIYDRSDSRQAVEAYTATLIENQMITSPQENDTDWIEALAERYIENRIFANQTSLVTHILSQEDGYITLEDDAVNFYPRSDMDAEQAIAYIIDELDTEWQDLIEGEYENKEGQPIYILDLQPEDLTVEDVAILQEYVVDNGKATEVLEWWLVDEWMSEQLDAIGECILTDGSNYWWGRTTSGQSIKMDGTMQKIAAKYIQYQ